ncbi:4-hydroxy-2-oxovalerate aldolase [Clostridium sp. MCC353]|uniref:4-hydroxy-2-oxovalerate aldolase n=1 Tax=Clostridium sp. MCC353 TaxID=2592646 RepID=UPI0031FF1C43
MLQLMDCTLRDGANVVGKGFPADLTTMILKGLTAAKVPVIEFGNAGGIGAYEVAGFTQAETDETYLSLVKPYLGQAKTGMFLNARRYRENYIDMAKAGGIDFLRCGADAGDCGITFEPIKAIKKRGMEAFYSAMKAYLLTPQELAEEAKQLEAIGLDEFTIMDSAGAMFPDEVSRYVEALVKAVKIPIGFHGHNNLAFSAANAVAAYENGASILDCGLMGMARSAGNMPTEICAAVMQNKGEMEDVDLYALLECIDQIAPVMKERYGYHNPIPPFDLILGLSGAHSSFGKLFRSAASEAGVSLYKLIVEVSKENRKNPNEDLVRAVAKRIKA